MEYLLLGIAGILGGIGHFFYKDKAISIIKSLVLGVIAALIVPLFLLLVFPDKYEIIKESSILLFGAAIVSSLFFEEMFLRLSNLFFIPPPVEPSSIQSEEDISSQDGNLESIGEVVVGVVGDVNTNRENRILNILSTGHPKSLGEIRNEAEFNSIRSVSRIISRLKQKGKIDEVLKNNRKAWIIKNN